MSGSIISSSIYFLWRITTFPETDNADATLIGVSVTCAIFLCAYGIGSGRGNPVESSLLVRITRLEKTYADDGSSRILCCACTKCMYSDPACKLH